ncbi:MAG: hypothetical protein JRN26_06520 [Nitrososphaerota archaeon]|jgi:hypothetical protein|nr:hypothetical protein [Nitrososphaerota archaeon]MDG6936516.1 hypothetical protein [Nitrososphaerota archaeon]MDG6944991.1 hypothetical protein [Nitrososphaerota archaeon]
MDKKLLLIVMLILLAAFPSVANAQQGVHHSGLLPLAGNSKLQGTGLPPAQYDEQLGESFTQDFTSIGFNVTAIPQTDSYGYGPAYLVNGLSNTGYWYQVGLSYDWPYSNGGYSPGFSMDYEVFDPSGNSIFPASGGGSASFSGPVNPGDKVYINLYFSSNGQVVMTAVDQNTGAYASETYSAEGATYFVGQSSSYSNSNGFFTGLMTEWYHVSPYYGSEKQVTYSENGFQFTSAWLWADEWDTNTSQTLFSSSTQGPVSLTYNLYPFSTNGAIEYASSSAFITGPIKLSLVSFSFKPETTDFSLPVGIEFSSQLSGGVPPYTYFIYVDGKTIANFTTPQISSSYSLSINNLSVGQHEFYVMVADFAGNTNASPSYTITINPDPTVTLVAKQGTYDLGQAFNVSSVASGGTQPYSMTYYVNGTPVGGNIPAPKRPGAYSVYVQLVDAAGYTVYSRPLYLIVNPDPSISLSSNSSAYDAGQYLGIRANDANGTPPYFVVYYINNSPTENPVSELNSPGVYQIYASLTDSLGYRVNSSAIAVHVNPDPSITISAQKFVYDKGQNVSVSTSVTGGTPPYAITYLLNNSEVKGTAIELSHPGFYLAGAELSDAAGYTVKSNILKFTVNPDPSVSWSYATGSNSIFYSNNIVNINALISNGTAPYTYTWYLNGKHVASTSTPSYTYHLTKMGLNDLNLAITDSAGYTVGRFISINYSYNYANMAIIAIAAAVIILVLILRKQMHH